MPASWNEAIASLKQNVTGQVVLPEDANYDEVRSIWNAMINRRPAVLIRCATATDVQVALAFARANGKEFTIRGALGIISLEIQYVMTG